jgi:hypothetical protein
MGQGGSLLNWEVVDWPDWGSNWEFKPKSYNGLGYSVYGMPVYVTFNVPSDRGDYGGGNDDRIKVINTDPKYSDQVAYVSISLTAATSRDRPLFFNLFEMLKARFPFLTFLNDFSRTRFEVIKG